MPKKDKLIEAAIEAHVKLIKRAQDAYYNGTPIMTDAEYDRTCARLIELDRENPVLKNVGAKPPQNSPLQKVQHTIPMGSQNKVNTEEEFAAWAKKTGAMQFLVQEKLDGLSVELIYENGKLLQASTRGDGYVGEDITHNVVKMKNVQQQLGTFTGALRGEIILPISIFDSFFKASGEYTTARNTASGIARRKTQLNRSAEHLEVYYFDILTDEEEFSTENMKMDFIRSKLNLRVADYCIAPELLAVKNVYKDYQTKIRARLSYEIDALVVKVNNLELQKELGEINNRPKGQVAWKFPSTEVKTFLRKLTAEYGLTGRITPVAHVDPVEVGGVTVSKMSVYNYANVRELGLYPGAEVIISRRGDVIPALERVVSKIESGAIFGPPTICPECDKPLRFQGEFLVCPNRTCPGKIVGDLQKWVNVLELDQIGPAFIKKLAGNKLKSVADFYRLSLQDIANLEGYGLTSATKILESINSKRVLSLSTFMAALNIPDVSIGTFEILENANYDYYDLDEATVEDLAEIKGIGEVTAKAIVVGMRKKKDLIEELVPDYITIAKKEKIEGKLSGMSFCFTGEISIKRGDAQRIVKELGGEVKTAVSKGLTYLVQADPKSNSTKAQKARQYGTKVIGEDEFMDMVGFTFEMLLRKK